MGPRVRLSHTTAYRFSPAVRLGAHVLRLRPAPDAATVLTHDLRVEPAAHRLRWALDDHGTWQGHLEVEGPVDSLVLDARLELDLGRHGVGSDPGLDAPLAVETAVTPVHTDPGEAGALDALLAGLTRGDDATLAEALACTAAVAAAVAHEERGEPGARPVAQTLAAATGSCRDSAWVLVQALALRGVPARFAAGYLVALDDPGAGGDRSSLHAWCEVPLADGRWVGLDATSGQRTGAGHVLLARGADPAAAAVVSGTTEPCQVTLVVRHEVARLDGRPDG